MRREKEPETATADEAVGHTFIEVAVEDPPAAAAPAAKRPIEAWARDKGMLPQIFGGATYALPGGAPVDRMGGAAVALGQLAGPRGNPEFWRFAAAKAGSQWPENLEVTEAEFDAAVELATNGHQLR
jgi:hypothetical protein